ncbi:MAG: peptidylprolyl isomerase [Planctomycetes bacterium]|nr:peptidylprolyl isomerase [Planctomycetota bacterium]
MRLETSHGTIDAKLRADLAFQTATAYATLVKRGFFDGIKFHRVIQGFMAQGGDPKGEGWGGPGYTLRRELHGKLPHTRGVFSMARQQRPDTAGSQFFIMFRNAPELDKLGYTTFGEMAAGGETLARIEALGSNAPDGGPQAPKEPISIKKATLIFLK